MPVLPIVGGCVLTLLGVAGLWRAVRMWRDPSLVEQAVLARRVLPFSQGTRRGMVAGSVPLAVGLLLIGPGVLVIALSAPVPHHLKPGGLVGAVLVGLGLVALACHYSIAWLHRPAWLIPPHLRSPR